MSTPDSNKKLQNTSIDDDWIDVCDVVSSNPYTDPTIAIAGAEALPTAEVWACELCHANFSGVEPYQQHMTGSKHKKKQRKELMKEKYGPKYLEMLKRQESGSEVDTDVTSTPNEDDDVVVKYCDVCKKICTGEVTYELHMNGKPHRKKVHKMNLLEKLRGNPDVDLDDKKEKSQDSAYDVMPQLFAYCKVCNKKFSGPEGFQDHLSSTPHKKKLSIQVLSENLTAEGSSLDLVKAESANQNAENSGGGDFFAHCSACEKNFSGPVPYQQHLVSEIHKKKLKKIELTKQMSSLSVKDEEDIFECKECGRSFIIPEEFDQHLKSSVHTKKQAKHQLVKKLQNEYPEMEVQLVTANDSVSLENDTDLLDKSFILICSVCHKGFSGPENARAHFTSPKHLKTKKHLILAEQRKTEIKKKSSF